MLKFFLLVFMMLVSNITVLSQVSDQKEYWYRFSTARSLQDVETIERLIDELQEVILKEKADGIEHKLLLAEALIERAMLSSDAKEKKKHLETSLKIIKEILSMDVNVGKAHYLYALAISRLMEHVDVFRKLSMLKDFDHHMQKAVDLLDEPLYLGLALMGFGIRYMSPPWPFNDHKKARFYLEKATEYIPDYSGVYLYLGIYHLKFGHKEEARKMFLKVLSTKPHQLFIKAHEENVKEALEYLERM